MEGVHVHQPDHSANDVVRLIFRCSADYLSALLIIATMICMSAAPAAADKRVALVIGNGAYENVPHLPNPANDAKDVADALQRSGFDTILGVDLDKAAMDAAAIRFARAARDADVALFCYSGHAMQYAGINYLAPIDAKLTDEADLRLLERVDDIVAHLQRAKNLRILVLDSCRDNPLADELKRSIGTTRGISIGRGLAKIDSPEGLIVAYATQAGRTAEDGTGRHSPFTTAFLKCIETPEEIGTIFRKISADVYTQTKQAQLPELSLSLIGEFYLRGRVEARTSPEPAPPPAPALSEAAQAWAATKDTTSQAVLEDFIRQFGNTVYGSLAKARLEELKSSAQSRPAQNLEALVPETVPYIHDSDRAVIRSVYLSAPDHKALAISVTQIGFVSGQATDEAAKTAALASCQKTTDAGGSIAVGQRCELYALGNTVVYAQGRPPLPPKPWLVRDPTIERPFAVKDVPIVNENQRAGIAKCYPDVGLYSKALAISPRGSACYRNQQSTDEAIRRALETCGNSSGVPCMIMAVDDKFVVPIPTTMKAIGFFRPSSDTTLAADARDDVARKLSNASGGWSAVAVGANGRPGIAVKAASEQAALDGALTDCSKHDQDCRVISIGPFLVEPKSSSTGSGQTGSIDPLMRNVVTDCDRLAAYPWDPHGANGVNGVAFGKIDIVPALTACNEAMRQYPDVARFVFQAGRIAFQQKDYVLARQYFEKAIAMGSDAGMAGLGLHYQYGLGVPQDYNEARRWYEKGVAAGIPGAMNSLGSLYETGTGVAKDYNEARKWYEKAAAVGEPNAMRNLGNLYQNGNGVPQDKVTARQWYEKQQQPATINRRIFSRHWTRPLPRPSHDRSPFVDTSIAVLHRYRGQPRKGLKRTVAGLHECLDSDYRICRQQRLFALPL
jgi:uncharacterized caspase-like protein/tetratricopeptide (TPR) repeat protein